MNKVIMVILSYFVLGASYIDSAGHGTWIDRDTNIQRLQSVLEREQNILNEVNVLYTDEQAKAEPDTHEIQRYRARAELAQRMIGKIKKRMRELQGV